MAENFANDVSGLLSAAIANGTDTTVNMQSATGFPAVNFRIRIDNEYMLVTSLGTGLNWTVTRAIEGTTGVAHSNGAPVYQIVTVGGLSQYITDKLPVSAYAELKTSSTGATTIPNDDTIPQITEGNEFLTLPYTRRSASSFLYIEADGYAGEQANSGSAVIAALFQDAIAGALVAGFADTANGADQVFGINFSAGHFHLSIRIASGAAGATTFRLRIGCDAGSVRVNGVNAARRLGGALITSIKLTESDS